MRELEVLRLLHLKQPVDVFLSHDWPQHIARHGDIPQLVGKKRHLQERAGSALPPHNDNRHLSTSTSTTTCRRR